MVLVKQGGVKVVEAAPLGKDLRSLQEFVYKCPHDGAVIDKPGPCPKCQMPLGEPHKVPKATPLPAPGGTPPANAVQEFVYKCPHDGAVIDKPGPCPKCKMPLDERHKVPKEAPPSEERTVYVCDVHPEKVFDKPGQCFKDS